MGRRVAEEGREAAFRKMSHLLAMSWTPISSNLVPLLVKGELQS